MSFVDAAILPFFVVLLLFLTPLNESELFLDNVK